MKDSLLVVVPVLVDDDVTRRCLRSVLDPTSSFGVPPERVLLVDNTRHGDFESWHGGRISVYRHPNGHNLGVARSWNVGARLVLTQGLDYLVLMSSVMEFGPLLHCTWLWQMNQFWGANVIECDGHSWHLIALHRNLFEAVGLFDENFYPAYEESIDWCYRLRLKGLEGGWPHVWCNALSQGAARHASMVATPNEPLRRYYEAKWGGPKGHEQFDLPWGDQPLDYWPTYSIPQLADQYALGQYGTDWW